MKRMATTAAILALMAGAAFAQGMGPQGGHESMGPGFGIHWQLGTVVTAEDKKVTGQILFGERFEPVLKVDGVEYLLSIPRKAYAVLDLKNGDTITVEGIAITVKSDEPVLPRFRAMKVTIGGKEIDLRRYEFHRGFGNHMHHPEGNSMPPMGNGAGPQN